MAISQALHGYVTMVRVTGARPRGEPALRRAPPDAVRQPHQPFEV